MNEPFAVTSGSVVPRPYHPIRMGGKDLDLWSAPDFGILRL